MVRVVQRALSVLECFDAEKPSLSLHEIAGRINLPKSTAFRLVATLMDAGYLVQRANQEYSLSYKLLWLASVVQHSFDVRELARPVMKEIADTSGETVDLSILSGDDRICLDVIESRSSLKSIVVPGDRLPLIHGATGKVFLAQMKDDEVRTILKKTKDVRNIDLKAYFAQLGEIRAQGYSITHNERVLGATAVAVPLCDADHVVRYCLTLTGPSIRFDSRADEFCKIMLRAGEELSARLGRRTPPAETLT